MQLAYLLKNMMLFVKGTVSRQVGPLTSKLLARAMTPENILQIWWNEKHKSFKAKYEEQLAVGGSNFI